MRRRQWGLNDFVAAMPPYIADRLCLSVKPLAISSRLRLELRSRRRSLNKNHVDAIGKSETYRDVLRQSRKTNNY
jgi:hypothetical protein